MAKTTTLPFTQNIKTPVVVFGPSDLLSVTTVSPASNGTNLSAGLRTFTAVNGAAGVVKTGGAAASWTVTASDSRALGNITLVNPGDYLVLPSDLATNAATVDSGSTNATWAFTTGILKTLCTAGANDSVVKALNVASTDSAARIMTLYLSDASNTFNAIIGAVNIPLTAGTGSGTTAAIDLINSTLFPSLPYDANGKRVLPLQAGYVLKASVPAVTAGKLISVIPVVEDY